MLLFDGVALESVAPVRIDDIVVSPVTQAATVVDRAVLSGADFVRIRGKTRTITITFAILTNDMQNRATYMQSVRRWAAKAQPCRMMLPDRIGQYIMAVCTTPPSLSLRKWWETVKMVFTSYEPFFESTGENSSACGTPFMVNGSAEPRMQIRENISQALDAPSWVWNGKKTISLSGTVGPGALVIDLTRQMITLNGQSIMSSYVFPDSDFFAPQIGYNNITGPGRVFWRERWE